MGRRKLRSRWKEDGARRIEKDARCVVRNVKRINEEGRGHRDSGAQRRLRSSYKIFEG